nr:unnamed protein product [Callosobruchus chinensis]
MGHSRSGTL